MYQSYLYGIEMHTIIYNLTMTNSINRTFMELKFLFFIQSCVYQQRINRTFMELK